MLKIVAKKSIWDKQYKRQEISDYFKAIAIKTNYEISLKKKF